MSNEAVRTFEREVLFPALSEVTAAPALLADYSAEVVTQRPCADPAAEELLAALAGAVRRTAGPSLVITNRHAPPDVSRLAGRYVMTTCYELDDGRAFASPTVLFWMRFNNKLHVFNHRYDDSIEYHDVQSITRPHVLNHILRSFDFYKLYALSDRPFPGYGGSR